MPNLAALHEAIAAALPDLECLVFGARRFTWRAITERTCRLASVLCAAGLGCRREREALANHESGQDHVALYLYNGNEYLEGMLGAMKARCAPFNVNYRYVDAELVYLFQNADAKAVVFHNSFAPALARIRQQLPSVRLWLSVDDGSRERLEGAHSYEQALAAAQPDEPQQLSEDDLYILYTGGTTGMPKGVLWRQDEILRAALLPAGTQPTTEAIVERARRGAGRSRGLPTAPFMHGAAHWGAFTMWHTGAAVCVQESVRSFDPHDVLATIERERISSLTIVGDAFARPLLEALRAHAYDTSSLQTITSGGAILTASVKDELLARIPQARVLDVLGSSESGQQATQVSRSGKKATTGDFELAASNVVLSEDLTHVVPAGSDEAGWLARSGPVPLGYYKDPEKTARSFPVIGGVRYAVPGDRAVALAGGGLQLLGRDSVTINSGGEKIFAEEIEQALKHHPAVWDAVVTGTPHERFGQQVTAVVALRAGVSASEAELRECCEAQIARYKLPRAFVFVDEVVRAPSGKADYRWAKQVANAKLSEATPRLSGA